MRTSYRECKSPNFTNIGVQKMPFGEKFTFQKPFLPTVSRRTSLLISHGTNAATDCRITPRCALPSEKYGLSHAVFKRLLKNVYFC